MISYLLAYICASATMSDCQVWSEGAWTGPAASVYCTVERDAAESRFVDRVTRGLNEYDTAFVRFECASQPAGE